MTMMRSPLARALKAAGSSIDPDTQFLYQDYLYELCARGNSRHTPVTEDQWEMLCDIQGKRKPAYASTTKAAVEQVERRNS